MKLKVLTFGTLAASTVIFASTVISPAEAAIVTGTLNFAKDGGVNSITNSKVDFVNTNDFFSVGQSSTGTFAGLKGSGVTILNDLTLPFSGAFDFLKVNAGPTFRITGFGASNVQTFNGLPAFGGNVLGNFIFDGDNTLVKPSSFILAFDSSHGDFANISIKADDAAIPIPTPALLPGLVGMGIAALRKRKSAESETVDA